jgi:hypothetical protein
MPFDRTNIKGQPFGRLFLSVCICAALLGCEPTVRVEAPKEPITINLNIKLEAEVRVKLEEAAKEDIEENPELF